MLSVVMSFSFSSLRSLSLFLAAWKRRSEAKPGFCSEGTSAAELWSFSTNGEWTWLWIYGWSFLAVHQCAASSLAKLALWLMRKLTCIDPWETNRQSWRAGAGGHSKVNQSPCSVSLPVGQHPEWWQITDYISDQRINIKHNPLSTHTGPHFCCNMPSPDGLFHIFSAVTCVLSILVWREYAKRYSALAMILNR